MTLTKTEKGANINFTAGQIMGRAEFLQDEKLILLVEKLHKDLDRLKVYDEKRKTII